ncbi:hypothetical protein [Microcoleus sp.]|uniref:hypothetical protein n=1 Tax=Microcoleus sp. TaxID=44472 RepID=UPI0035254ADA
MSDKRYEPDGNGNLIRITKENSDGSYEFIARPENNSGQERLHGGVDSNGNLSWFAVTDENGKKIDGSKNFSKYVINTAVQVANALMND